jgi:hypothetical protein
LFGQSGFYQGIIQLSQAAIRVRIVQIQKTDDSFSVRTESTLRPHAQLRLTPKCRENQGGSSMLARILGGVAVWVGVAGSIQAQMPPAQLPKSKPPAPMAPAKLAPQTTPAPAAPTSAAAVPANAPATTASNLLTNGGCGAVPCPDVCNPCCAPCGPPGRYWIDAGYIFWNVSGQNAPPLVTASPAGTPRQNANFVPIAGALGQPTTSVLYPNGSLNNDWRSGFYINAGMWLDCCQTCGIEMNGFYLGKSRDNYSLGDPTGNSIITRPFFNATTGLPDAQLVSFPNILAGTVTVASTSTLWGLNPNLVKNLCCGPCGRFDLLLGYTYLSLDDTIVIREDLTSLPGQQDVPPGTRFQIEDSFRTQNDFHGVNIGFAFERRFSHWYVGGRAGVALGVVHQEVDISGYTIITPPGGPSTTFPGGLLTQTTNIGHYERDVFGVQPWLGVRFGCQVTKCLRAYVGYDWMYLSNVVRAGDVIDPRVNENLIAPPVVPFSGPAVPAFNWNSSGVHVHGVRFGVEVRF